jgi:hypothetical protein
MSCGLTLTEFAAKRALFRHSWSSRLLRRPESGCHFKLNSFSLQSKPPVLNTWKHSWGSCVWWSTLTSNAIRQSQEDRSHKSCGLHGHRPCRHFPTPVARFEPLLCCSIPLPLPRPPPVYLRPFQSLPCQPSHCPSSIWAPSPCLPEAVLSAVQFRPMATSMPEIVSGIRPPFTKMETTLGTALFGARTRCRLFFPFFKGTHLVTPLFFLPPSHQHRLIFLQHVKSISAKGCLECSDPPLPPPPPPHTHARAHTHPSLCLAQAWIFKIQNRQNTCMTQAQQ